MQILFTVLLVGIFLNVNAKEICTTVAMKQSLNFNICVDSEKAFNQKNNLQFIKALREDIFRANSYNRDMKSFYKAIETYQSERYISGNGFDDTKRLAYSVIITSSKWIK